MSTITLNKLAEIFSGQGAPQGEKCFGHKGLPFVRAGSLDFLLSGGKEDDLERVSDEVANEYQLKPYLEGTILFAKSGMSATKDRVYTLKSTCYVVNHLAAIIPKKPVDTDFLKFWFRHFRPSQLIKDKAYPSIRLSDIEEIKVPDFSDEKKRHIISILKKAESAKQKRQEAIRLTDEFLKSAFLDMFGDPLKNSKNIRKLTEVCDLNPKLESEITDDEEVSFVPMSAVSTTGKVDASQVRKYNEVRTGFTYFQERDVLFAKITPCMENGKGGIAKNLKNGIGFGSTEFHVLRPTKETTSEWIYFLLSFRHVREIAARRMTGTAGQKRVPVSFLQSLKVSIPPIEQQQKFADLVQKVEALKSKQQESKQGLDNLFNSLMQKVFKGEIS